MPCVLRQRVARALSLYRFTGRFVCDAAAAVLQPVARSDRAPEAQLIERAAAMISTAKRPLVIAGEMISNQDASQALTEFADAAALPDECLPASRRDG